MNKIVPADTSCLIALGKVDLLHLLKDMFDEVIVTEEVRQEYGNDFLNLIKVKSSTNKIRQIDIESQLDRSEASSLALAIELIN